MGVMQNGAKFNGSFAQRPLAFAGPLLHPVQERGTQTMALQQKPHARADELVVRDMDSEVLIYDLNKDEAITLNFFAAAVWRAADGTRDVTGLTAKLHDAMPGDLVTEDAVWRALDMLSRCDLLQEPVMAPTDRVRRAFVKTLGVGVVAVPIVAMISVPSAAQAASCGCVSPGNCLTQTSCASTVNCNGGGICAP